MLTCSNGFCQEAAMPPVFLSMQSTAQQQVRCQFLVDENKNRFFFHKKLKKTEMEEKVSNHGKYGYFIFRKYYRKHHFNQICQSLSSRSKKNVCNKRHPRPFKRFILEVFCRFQNSCEYFHSENNYIKNKNYLLISIIKQNYCSKRFRHLKLS